MSSQLQPLVFPNNSEKKIQKPASQTFIYNLPPRKPTKQHNRKLNQPEKLILHIRNLEFSSQLDRFSQPDRPYPEIVLPKDVLEKRGQSSFHDSKKLLFNSHKFTRKRFPPVKKPMVGNQGKGPKRQSGSPILSFIRKKRLEKRADSEQSLGQFLSTNNDETEVAHVNSTIGSPDNLEMMESYEKNSSLDEDSYNRENPTLDENAQEAIQAGESTEENLNNETIEQFEEPAEEQTVAEEPAPETTEEPNVAEEQPQEPTEEQNVAEEPATEQAEEQNVVEEQPQEQDVAESTEQVEEVPPSIEPAEENTVDESNEPSEEPTGAEAAEEQLIVVPPSEEQETVDQGENQPEQIDQEPELTEENLENKEESNDTQSDNIEQDGNE